MNQLKSRGSIAGNAKIRLYNIFHYVQCCVKFDFLFYSILFQRTMYGAAYSEVTIRETIFRIFYSNLIRIKMYNFE